uniref:Uncharacterized protein n=1 Tax=Craspedostauros australis TaxID=1486917 RepID=A0A7R9ZMM4_9STRA|mmetsp:Transcript_21656/g.60293  ORF Transcript_21656/g.60293 Transcript_21656/m.60293 type:complete len:278 (+) Transcript_21656:592-1425(+)|eukprot:CAMPEP_0198111632 /NCGR_PEP_ID=MMETSP1442-20131203/3575_1 /TAXON_ID= /ORGANISM="Craspedostauros australis, Strain CCMP3328" /LENGTH=277 /DNA_ID=CAMNT_0043768143 /DNA_START=576 /DNA_END=1409 /DNA_ORIENTATION=-
MTTIAKDAPPTMAPTDTSVATDKITAATTASSNDSMRAIGRADDERSLEALEGLGAFQSKDDEEVTQPIKSGKTHDIPAYTPPLRINAGDGTSAIHRMSNSTGNFNIPPTLQTQLRSRRKSDSGGIRSGSRSPISGSRHTGAHYDGGSSISSLDDIIDPDILTDKMGFLELDLKQQQECAQNLNASFSNLPPVTERMSEGTLEDVHAFCDVRSGHGSISRGNSITTGGEVSSNVLEPLEECDNEDENETGRVILTNMEEILEADEEDHHEAPSVPTM